MRSGHRSSHNRTVLPTRKESDYGPSRLVPDSRGGCRVGHGRRGGWLHCHADHEPARLHATPPLRPGCGGPAHHCGRVAIWTAADSAKHAG
ncbi:hypothetical protein FRUB_03038 [Fimbriiglobus ruber]|uniref:Uncharacterized protein n=1 Tax=Fimbriiglobus ruber TaxID=1908690 RepID=A0A225E1T6_9BACT|nr:hypothetical protein FRUB_03038 [Fimbriiglobus ruber]